MESVYEDNSLTIGRTPLVRIRRLFNEEGAAKILAKIEGRNPAHSVKCRIGASMIWAAEQSGQLGPGKAIVEATSGNTGIALAAAAASRGLECILAMPDTMSPERRKVLGAFGATVVLTPGAEGMKGAIARAGEIAASDPGRYTLMRQFENPANPAIHEATTGPEIWDDTRGEVDVLVAGVGTGGTLTGVSRYFERQRGKSLHSVAVEPAASPLIAQTLARKPLTPRPHRIQGLGPNFVPKNLDLSLVDQVEAVSIEEAIELARRLAREEGILCGVSSGAAMAAAVRVARDPAWAGKTIVVVLPDSGERYLSGALFEGVADTAVARRAS